MSHAHAMTATEKLVAFGSGVVTALTVPGARLLGMLDIHLPAWVAQSLAAGSAASAVAVTQIAAKRFDRWLDARTDGEVKRLTAERDELRALLARREAEHARELARANGQAQ